MFNVWESSCIEVSIVAEGEGTWRDPSGATSTRLTSPLARPASGLSGGSRGGGSMRMGHHGLRIGIRMWDSELKEQGLWVGNV